MRGERFENGVAEVGLRDDCSAGRVALFMDVLDHALGILDQIVVPPISDAGRGRWEKFLDCALLRRPGFGEFFARKLDVDVACASQP